MLAMAEQERTSAERYEALIRIANSIRARKDPSELFEMLVQELASIIPFDGIAQFDEQSNKVNWHLGGGCRAKAQRVRTTIATARWRRGSTVTRKPFCSQRSTARRASRYRLRKCARPVCSRYVRFRSRRLTASWGVWFIASVARNVYSEEEVRFCRLVADQIALAMDDAMNFEASQRAQQRLELLLDLTNRAVSSLDLQEILREISAHIRRVMQCDCVGIDLPGADDGKPRIQARDYPGAPMQIEEEEETAVIKQTATLRVFQTGESRILSYDDLVLEGLDRFGARSLAQVPLKGRSGILGVLSLGACCENAFAENDLAFLRQVAQQVAIAIENARLFSEVNEPAQ